MIAKPNALASYGRVANAETDRLQQIVMLYDGAIRFLRLAACSIETGDLQAKSEQTNRALDVIAYLQAILDFERGGDVARTLDHLYNQVAALVLRASAALDAETMRRAADVLVPVRDAWCQIRSGSTDNLPLNASPLSAPRVTVQP